MLNRHTNCKDETGHSEIAILRKFVGYIVRFNLGALHLFTSSYFEVSSIIILLFWHRYILCMYLNRKENIAFIEFYLIVNQ